MAAVPRSITLVQLRDRLLASAKSDMARLVCAALLEGLSIGPQGCARVMNGEFVKMLRPATFRQALYEGLDERDRAVLPQSLTVSALAAAPRAPARHDGRARAFTQRSALGVEPAPVQRLHVAQVCSFSGL